ncbi:hypothetical protein [Yersinia enterocolitica]|uniref:hypothetical protein n=1 Tax=Yersinia enterocolitica TaxID=630 RepID=UPI003F41B6ED
MTDEIKTGGLAFPFNDIGGDCDPGMTLRDYFAAKAMAALIPRYADVNIDDLEVLEEIAIRASNMADAMIKARG